MNTVKRSSNESSLSSNEIRTNLLQFKSKLISHIQERNSNQLNEQYVNFLESKIVELKKVLKERNAA